MEPIISSREEEIDIMRFQISGINVSFANALRRTLLSNISIPVFKASPYSETTIQIEVNDTLLNNEIIRHRISCIPIHITDPAFPLDRYSFQIDVQNDTENYLTVTTKDFVIIDTIDGNKVTEEQTRKIFPPDPLTGDFISIVKLRPKLSNDLKGQHIKLAASLTMGSAIDDGAFNVVSAASYAMTEDTEAQEIALKIYMKEQLAKQSETVTEELRDAIAKRWRILDGKRIVKKNSFDFIIESVGVFSPNDLIIKACEILLADLAAFQNKVAAPNSFADIYTFNPDGTFEISVERGGITMGKMIEYILFDQYYNLEDDAKLKLKFVSAFKKHPHVPNTTIKLQFKYTQEDEISQMAQGILSNASRQCSEVINKMITAFKI